MYVNDMRWAGRLTQDPRVFDPREPGDRVLFSFCVAQTIPWRNKTTGGTEESSQFINVNYRSQERYSGRLKEKLKKGQFVMVDGELLIEHKDTPTGRVTYVTINATKIQFPPVQYVNAKDQDQQSKEQAAPANAAEANPDVFNPARFEDDPVSE